ncbi:MULTISPECIES: DUF4214 domain-containing protein [unclassified Pseudomonas]|uniref:DUF4214 domain-containing protein n=1 Tax=unclassified Pseudomonas TaxID=196821 RepID=UPI0025DB1786|nr:MULTISPECIES: DUF4214 domain-containing protein [unclassified Pseudomonas]
MATTSAQVQQLYVAYLGRAADKAGLDYWLNELNADNATLTLDDLRTNFTTQQTEYTDAYAGLSRSDTVIKIYNNLFGRAPDAAGLTYWTTGGGASVNSDDLLSAFINGAGSDDAKVITNKVLVSEVYTSTAGTNYLAADAKSIIAGVGSDGTSVGNALNKLTDGSLSGIAIPAAVANLKAAAAADAAVTAFETTKAADLLAIEKQLVTLSTSDANIVDQTATSTASSSYSAVNTELSGDLTSARGNLGTTADLTTAANTTATALTSARTALTGADNQSVDHVTAYTTAAAAVKANVAVSAGDKQQAVDTLAAYGNNPANNAAWTKALSDAGITAGTTVADTAQSIYSALTSTTASADVIANVKTAFASVTNFASVTATSDKDLANLKAVAALQVADDNLNTTAGNAWIDAYNADVTAQSKLASSKALDALDSAYKAVDVAHTAATDAKATAAAKLDASDVLVDNGTTLSVTADANKAEVFYFANNKVTSSDGALTLTAGQDSLYIGEGYTLNKAATLSANGITGADNNSKEVFFFKAADNSVKAVIETSAVGSTTVADNTLAASATDGVSVITLTGVTSVDQVTFANGVISHVA